LKNTIVLIAIISTILGYSQNINESTFMGTWRISNVLIDNDIVLDATDQVAQEKKQLLKETLIDATLSFHGNGIFNIETRSETEFAGFLKNLDQTNWILEGSTIKIGHKKNNYSYANFEIIEENPFTIRASLLNFEMEKIESEAKSKFKKLKEKKEIRSAIIQSRIPVFRQKEFIEDEVVPYAVVDTPPLMKNCEKTGDVQKDKECTSQGISRLINRTFNTDLGADLGLTGINRIEVTGIIGKNGKIYNIEVTAPHPLLVEEAKRVFSYVPPLTPGYHEGKKVAVSYKFPITFQVVD